MQPSIHQQESVIILQNKQGYYVVASTSAGIHYPDKNLDIKLHPYPASVFFWTDLNLSVSVLINLLQARRNCNSKNAFQLF